MQRPIAGTLYTPECGRPNYFWVDLGRDKATRRLLEQATLAVQSPHATTVCGLPKSKSSLVDAETDVQGVGKL